MRKIRSITTIFRTEFPRLYAWINCKSSRGASFSTVNCKSAISCYCDATIPFVLIAQQWTTSDPTTINITFSAINCTHLPGPGLLDWPFHEMANFEKLAIFEVLWPWRNALGHCVKFGIFFGFSLWDWIFIKYFAFLYFLDSRHVTVTVTPWYFNLVVLLWRV